jgi:predicted HTH transcriptional regulator
MKIAEHSMADILYQQRQALLLAALNEPTTSPNLARKIGGNRRHITRKLRNLEAAGKVEVMNPGKHPLIWRKI